MSVNMAPHGDACLFIEKVYKEIPELCRDVKRSHVLEDDSIPPLYLVVREGH